MFPLQNFGFAFQLVRHCCWALRASSKKIQGADPLVLRASECGGICYDRDASRRIEGFVGQPMKNVDLEIIDPSAAASQLRVRSAAVGDGYFPEPDVENLAPDSSFLMICYSKWRMGFGSSAGFRM